MTEGLGEARCPVFDHVVGLIEAGDERVGVSLDGRVRAATSRSPQLGVVLSRVPARQGGPRLHVPCRQTDLAKRPSVRDGGARLDNPCHER